MVISGGHLIEIVLHYYISGNAVTSKSDGGCCSA
jgi:hypothetical protein